MIVKVKNEQDSWSYFECEIIHSKHTLMKDVVIGDAFVIFEKNPEEKDLETKNVKVLNIETNKSHLRTIITDRVCYILNSEGKTVDRI